MIEILRVVQTETDWLAVVRDSETRHWVSLSYPTEPDNAQILLDSETALFPPEPETIIEVVAEDGTVIL